MTSLATPSDLSPSIPPGCPGTTACSSRWAGRCTTAATSATCPSWLMLWRKPAARTRTSSVTAGQGASTSAAAGSWTFCWARSDAMTEAKWLACTDPTPMLDFLTKQASKRKLRLFGVACCRRLWHLLDEEHCKKLVEVGLPLGCENLLDLPL